VTAHPIPSGRIIAKRAIVFDIPQLLKPQGGGSALIPSETMKIEFHSGKSQEHTMKKLVYVSAVAVACIGLVPVHPVRAQEQSFTIANQVEYQAYTNAAWPT
jgi:hypothetical protein